MHTAGPEAAFERQWVMALLESVLLGVQKSYESGGRTRQFDILRPFLNFDDTGSDSTAAAETLGVSPAAARQAVHRLRERFSRALRDHLADTLAQPGAKAIDEELTALRAALAPSRFSTCFWGKACGAPAGQRSPPCPLAGKRRVIGFFQRGSRL